MTKLTPDHPLAADLENLARKTGATPTSSLSRDPAESIPLFLKVKGAADYKTKLDRAAWDLFQQLRSDEGLRASAGVDVIANGKPRGKIPNLTKTRAEKYVPALKLLLHSLAHVASTPVTKSDDGVQRRSFVAIPLGEDQFSKGTPLEDISHPTWKGAIMCLTHLGWLELAPMYYCPETGERFRTRVRPLGPLKEWMLSRGLIFHGHPQGTKRAKAVPDDRLLRVNIEGKQTDLTRPLSAEEEVLPVLNKSLRRQRLKISYPRYEDFEASFNFKDGSPRYWSGGQKDLYRVFSGEDGRAGRLYGHWVQQIPGRLRKTLTINGKPTVELDYSGMQLALLYAHAGREMPETVDLYAVPGQRREDMKLVLTRSVGNPSRAKTIEAIRYALHSKSRKQEGLAEELYEAFWKHHKGLSPEDQDLGAAWSKLQEMDSSLALRVLKRLDDQGITAIPIHDSFIVEAQYEDALREAMMEEFERAFGIGDITVRRT